MEGRGWQVVAFNICICGGHLRAYYAQSKVLRIVITQLEEPYALIAHVRFLGGAEVRKHPDLLE